MSKELLRRVRKVLSDFNQINTNNLLSINHLYCFKVARISALMSVCNWMSIGEVKGFKMKGFLNLPLVIEGSRLLFDFGWCKSSLSCTSLRFLCSFRLSLGYRGALVSAPTEYDLLLLTLCGFSVAIWNDY